MDDIRKQRNYGKIEMILSIIYGDNHSYRFFGTDMESIAKWAGVELIEVKGLRDLAYYMDENTISGEMIKSLMIKSEKDYFSIYRCIMKDVKDFGHLFTALLAKSGEEVAYETILKVSRFAKDEDIQKQEMFKELLMDYARRLTSRIHGLLHEYPYPLNVIDTLWIKDMVTEAQFKKLMERFGLS